MNNNKIIDCHCHFITLDDFELYKKSSCATIYLNIRSITHNSLISAYDFNTFKNVDNMYLTEAIDLDHLESELIRVENNIQQNKKIIAIKIYLGYQHYYANDEKIKKVTKLAEKYGISMIFHCGETYSSNTSENPDKFADAIYIEELAKQFKNVNFIASHMNWPKFDNIFNLCEKYENIFTCISGCLDEIDKKKRSLQVKRAIEIANKYLEIYPNLKNKLMYGTDFFYADVAFTDVSDYMKIVNNLNLDNKENILYNTFLIAYKINEKKS